MARATLKNAVNLAKPYILTMRIFTLLLLCAILFSCGKESNRGPETETHMIKWVADRFPGNHILKTELLISEDFDTIPNQFLYIENNSIVPNKSRFYEIFIQRPDRNNVQKVKIICHSEFDSIPKPEIIKWNLTFSYFNEKEKGKSVMITGKENLLEFDYLKSDTNSLEGVIGGYITVNSKEKGTYNLSFPKMFVTSDNIYSSELVNSYSKKGKRRKDDRKDRLEKELKDIPDDDPIEEPIESPKESHENDLEKHPEDAPKNTPKNFPDDKYIPKSFEKLMACK
jgi:hypothetical protein